MLSRILSRFTEWALKHHPVDKGASSSAPVQFGAYIIKDADAPTEAYITRVLFPRVFGFRPMLHHIHRPDYARELHNHPWAWACSFILSGSYDEERDDIGASQCSHVRERHVSRFNFIRRETWHRITKLHGDVWTLFVSGPRTDGWGFREWDPAWERYDVTPHSIYQARRDANREPAVFASDVAQATGEDLDKLAARYGFEREPTERYNGEHPEPDEALRYRVMFDVLGEYGMSKLAPQEPY